MKTLELHYPMIQFLIISDIPQFWLGDIRSRDVIRPIVRERKELMDYKGRYSCNKNSCALLNWPKGVLWNVYGSRQILEFQAVGLNIKPFSEPLFKTPFTFKNSTNHKWSPLYGHPLYTDSFVCRDKKLVYFL